MVSKVLSKVDADATEEMAIKKTVSIQRMKNNINRHLSKCKTGKIILPYYI
jgi:hypothetical protein